CRRLDGLPLAVELAAARVRVMSVPEIAGRLADRFSLLRGGARDAPQRHHTLHAVVDWSWNLLEPAGQAAMRRLSVFPAGFTADAARHLLSGADTGQVLEQLVDQSLLKLVDTGSGTRFSMLETVREFSTAAREDAGESEHAVDGFLGWAREFGAAHHGAPYGADPYLPLARIRAEHDNLVQALRHGLARADGGTVAAVSAVLASLWVIESNFPRMATLVADTSRLLSHFRPGPDQVEVTRTALTLSTAYSFIVEGPRAVRSLVALRRLPPAAPGSLAHAVAIVLGGGTAMPELRDSDQPLVAGAANGIASYAAEDEGDLAGALSAARRMLAAYEGQRVPWLWGLAHTRISELCLQVEQGAEAERHLRAALPVAERLGLWVDVVGIRWWLVLANLQRGAVDEAGRLLAQTAPEQADQDVVTFTYGLCVRAEIQLASGEVEAGLRLWRQVADRLRDADGSADPGDQTGLWAWTAEAAAVTVVAHAQHGRLDRVEDVAAELPHRLATMLARPSGQPFQAESRICGAMLLALAMVDLDRGQHTGDSAARAAGARMIALAERFRFLRTFQPTMSGARAGQAAVQADRSAYQDAVSRYADLSRSQLRAAALAALPVRDQT
ncbi:MAG: ATP-binding protein, partial [Natronosporangium sp.]